LALPRGVSARPKSPACLRARQIEIGIAVEDVFIVSFLGGEHIADRNRHFGATASNHGLKVCRQLVVERLLMTMTCRRSSLSAA
jgi:hypothetical protein